MCLVIGMESNVHNDKDDDKYEDNDKDKDNDKYKDKDDEEEGELTTASHAFITHCEMQLAS